MRPPVFTIVSGPNGAGKSTLTREGGIGGGELIDPDAIARRISPDDPERAALQAGKEALRRIEAAIVERRSFTQETTLASGSALRTAKRVQALGFEVEQHFVGLNDVEQSRRRVASRVRDGGHAIPDAAIERRFLKTFRNAEKLAWIADRSIFYDNSDPTNPHRVVLTWRGRDGVLGADPPPWAQALYGRLEAGRRGEAGSG